MGDDHICPNHSEKDPIFEEYHTSQDLNSWDEVESDSLDVSLEFNPDPVELECYKLQFSPIAWSNSGCYF